MYITESLFLEAKSPLGLGRCSPQEVFDGISRAVSRATNSGLFDASIGQVDICACDGCFTLPADVQTILSVNQSGQPTVIRSEWFEYSLNGTGTQKCAPCHFTTVQGKLFSTIKELSGPSIIVAEIENAADNQKEVRVFGWKADGTRIYTEGPGGVLEDGFLVPSVFGFSPPNPDAPAITRIDRVRKAETNGLVRLIAIDATDDTKRTLLGHYLPWETAPQYQRIKVASKTWIRVKYKRKDIKVRGIGDWINLDNEEALMFLLKAVKLGSQDAYAASQAAENEAMRLLSNQQESSSSPAEMNQPTIIFHEQPRGGGPAMFY